MKSVIIKLLVVSFILAGSFTSCEKDKAPALEGTTWKTEGLYYYWTQPGVEKSLYYKEFGPKDCEECYTLTFDTDHTAIAHSINVTLKLDLHNLNTNNFIGGGPLHCERYEKDGKEYCGSSDFREVIITAKSYSLTSGELMLFNDKMSTYLLFKAIKP